MASLSRPDKVMLESLIDKYDMQPDSIPHKKLVLDHCVTYYKFLRHQDYCRCRCFHECCDNPDNYVPEDLTAAERKKWYQANYYRSNKEKIKAKNKAWYEENLKKIPPL